MTYPPDRWAALGQAVTKAVKTSPLGIAEMARRATISDKYIRALMNGQARTYGAGAVRFGALFGWPNDWVDAILDGRFDPAKPIAPDDLRAIRDRLDRIERHLDLPPIDSPANVTQLSAPKPEPGRYAAEGPAGQPIKKTPRKRPSPPADSDP